MPNVHVGDIGTTIRLNTGVDISSSTTQQIFLRAPDGTNATKTASFTTDGTDFLLEWTSTVSTDFSEAGSWRAQSHVEYGDGTEWTGNAFDFTVREKYE